ncbi:hypothetical protein WR25_16116 [Diploscapter pachys]|uniref:Uncharacterized protein n=1 Tax=Diploscapter pachys TaxID=2018661 RepID=A0A2A2LB19_9BILA|nr:hypothetical protein WR25_16116 [Diploscapter pachys]
MLQVMGLASVKMPIFWLRSPAIAVTCAKFRRFRLSLYLYAFFYYLSDSSTLHRILRIVFRRSPIRATPSSRTSRGLGGRRVD